MERIVKKDYLARQKDKENVLNIIRAATNRKEKLSFAIDGRWGSGKSFFIDLLEQDLKKDYFVFKYDSWENDYYDDPLIGMLDSVKDQLNKINSVENGLKEAQKEIIKNIAKTIGLFLDKVISNRFGVEPVETIKSVKAFWEKCSKKSKINDDFNPYNKIKAAKQLIVAVMNELIEIKPIIFIVDEIDRCFPTYTLKIIQRIHHISENVDQCISIFSVDTKQLQRIIELVYSKEDKESDNDEKDIVRGYLRKVIDFSYDLGVGKLTDDFFDELEDYGKRFDEHITNIEEKEIREFIQHLFSGLEMRTILRIINDAKYAHDLVFGTHKYSGDLMLAELMFAWAMNKYKDNILDKMGEDIRGDVSKLTGFLFYLSKTDRDFRGPYYDDFMEKWYCPVHDLRSFMKSMILYPKFSPRYEGHFNRYNKKNPPYIQKLTTDYIDGLAKIKC